MEMQRIDMEQVRREVADRDARREKLQREQRAFARKRAHGGGRPSKPNPSKEIDGSRTIHEFLILHEGWECDNLGWVTEDGRVWTTSHAGRPYEIEDAGMELGLQRELTLKSLRGIERAIVLAAERK